MILIFVSVGKENIGWFDCRAALKKMQIWYFGWVINDSLRSNKSIELNFSSIHHQNIRIEPFIDDSKFVIVEEKLYSMLLIPFVVLELQLLKYFWIYLVLKFILGEILFLFLIVFDVVVQFVMVIGVWGFLLTHQHCYLPLILILP